MKTRDLGLLLLGLVSATAAGAQEASLNRPGTGARAAGMGNAFIAVSDDGTAASWNPAGLSQLRQPEFSLVHSTSWRRQSREGYRTLDRTAVFTNLATSSTTSNVEFVSAALPFSVTDRPVTLQFGWRRIYQFGDKLQGTIRRVPTAAEARPEASIDLNNASSGNIHLWTVAAAIRLTSRLSIGVGADFYRGGWDDRASVTETPGIADQTDFLTNLTTHEVGGHSFNLGILLAYPKVRLGAVYHGPLRSRFELSESIRSNLVAPSDTAFGQNGGLYIHLPRSVGVGVAWLPRPLLRFAADLTYDEWTKFLVDGNPAADGGVTSGFDGLPPELSPTRNTITVNAGVERLFPSGGKVIPLRLGFSHEPQGARDPYLRENADQTILAAGTGINTNTLKLDVALEYRWGRFGSSGGLSLVYATGRAEDFGLPLPPEAQGTTGIREWRLKLSLIYRLASVGQLFGVLGKPF
ncbi:MAG: outer membrane protein transport protein [Gemmatimonadales bacterium]